MRGEDDRGHGVKYRVYFRIEHGDFDQGIHVLLDVGHDKSYLIEKL